MEVAERQFCILSTIAFSCCANGINNHSRLSYTVFQVSKSRKYLNPTPLEVSPNFLTHTTRVKVTSCHSVQSEWPATPNNNNRQTAEWYTADVAPSTLLWLVGPKDCVEISIPELDRLICNSLLSGSLL